MPSLFLSESGSWQRSYIESSADMQCQETRLPKMPFHLGNAYMDIQKNNSWFYHSFRAGLFLHNKDGEAEGFQPCLLTSQESLCTLSMQPFQSEYCMVR